MGNTVKVFGGIAGAALDWPRLSFTGTWHRRVMEYGGVWYYEYLLLGSGTLTSQGDYPCDAFLVGGGGNGAASPGTSDYAYPSPGGGSGYPVFSPGRLIAAGDHAVSVGAAANTSIALDTAVSAQKGGNATASSSASAAGSGFTQTYYLYNDETRPAGTGGGAARGSGSPLFVIPGSGGGGCTMLPYIKPGPALRRDNSYVRNWGPVASSKSGFGAGAMGRAARVEYNGTEYAQWDTSPAAGVAALRIRAV